jgi:two-component system, chemotaxis family, response regulator PixG
MTYTPSPPAITKRSPGGIAPILNTLEDVANKQASGYLKCTANGVTWHVYLKGGKVFYVNFSLEPLERLELVCRRNLSGSRGELDWRIFGRWQQRVAIAKLDDFYPSYDYQLIHSLVRKQRLSNNAAITIIQDLTQESFRNLLLADQIEYSFIADERSFPLLWSTNFLSLAKDCQKEIDGWQALGAGIVSPYQRLFIVKNQPPTMVLAEVKAWITGVDFHHLALPMGRSPLGVAQYLRSSIAQGAIGLRRPKVPWHNLPTFGPLLNTGEMASPVTAPDRYRIVCVDDSPTILQRMKLFLDRNTFEVVSILEPSAALTKVLAIKPQMILLDITMPQIDGYQLCAMIRRHREFKTLPIIMVTSNTGFFDRTRAKLVGATDYLVKPFTAEGLNSMIGKYLPLP